MKVDAVRAKALVSQLQEVQHRIANVAKGRNVSFMCDARCTPTTPLQHQAIRFSSHLGWAWCRCRGARRPAMPEAEDRASVPMWW